MHILLGARAWAAILRVRARDAPGRSSPASRPAGTAPPQQQVQGYGGSRSLPSNRRFLTASSLSPRPGGYPQSRAAFEAARRLIPQGIGCGIPRKRTVGPETVPYRFQTVCTFVLIRMSSHQRGKFRDLVKQPRGCDGFQNRCLKPLGHPSLGKLAIPRVFRLQVHARRNKTGGRGPSMPFSRPRETDVPVE